MLNYTNSRAIGNIGESVAITEFIKKEIPVFIPFGQNTPVDLLIYINEKFVKIQVKTTEMLKNGAMEFDISRTNGFSGRRKKYTEKEVDYFFLYCVENEFKGLVSFEELGTRYSLKIRCDKSRNGQQNGVNNMVDYQFEKRIDLLKEIV